MDDNLYNLDMNTAGEQLGGSEVIPAGTLAKLHMTIRPGGVGPEGWLTASKTSDAVYLNAEFTVMEGEFAKRKVWQNLTVAGGKLDERGQSKAAGISKATLRAVLESALGIHPKDESPGAQAARRVGSYGAFSGLEFAARLGVQEASGGYKPKNQIDIVITPDRPEWSVIMGMAQVYASANAQPPQNSGAPSAYAAQQPAQGRLAAGNLPTWASR